MKENVKKKYIFFLPSYSVNFRRVVIFVRNMCLFRKDKLKLEERGFRCDL